MGNYDLLSHVAAQSGLGLGEGFGGKEEPDVEMWCGFVFAIALTAMYVFFWEDANGVLNTIQIFFFFLCFMCCHSPLDSNRKKDQKYHKKSRVLTTLVPLMLVPIVINAATNLTYMGYNFPHGVVFYYPGMRMEKVLLIDESQLCWLICVTLLMLLTMSLSLRNCIKELRKKEKRG